MSFDFRNEGRGLKLLLLFIFCILDSLLSAYVWDAEITFSNIILQVS